MPRSLPVLLLVALGGALSAGTAAAHLATDLAVGSQHSCVVTSDGGVLCWGDNAYGQLGDGSSLSRPAPVAVSGLPAEAVTVTTGFLHTCAVTTGGAVVCWGENAKGQLGDGTTTLRRTPVAVAVLGSGVSQVSATFDHTCAVTTAGAVFCWGANSSGQLGDGTTTNRTTPVPVTGLSSGVVAVAAGGSHTCALSANGAVHCWGANSQGQLGTGALLDASVPVPVVGLSGGVAAIAAGHWHSCAIGDGGRASCWGRNNRGQLGDGTSSTQTTPVAVTVVSGAVASIDGGDLDTCALTTEGATLCWGDQNGAAGSPARVVLADGAVKVQSDGGRSCVLMDEGAVRCWGSSDPYTSTLGDGTSVTRTIPVPVVGLARNTAAVTAGWNHTCAVSTDGAVQCWGLNHSGQLGDGTTTTRRAPTSVVGLSRGVVAVAAGANHSCALTSGGGVQCWGANSDGQLGDGTRTEQVTPVAVVGLDSGVVAVTAGYRHTCALTTSGAVRCWGDNGSGELGDGTSHIRLTPVPVAGLDGGVVAVSAGGGVSCRHLDGTLRCRPVAHTCAVTASGAVRCWGSNSSGQIGDGSGVDQPTPVDVAGLPGAAHAVAAGPEGSCAVTSVGALLCWGRNEYGQLGNGTAVTQPTPVPVVGLADGVTAVSVGTAHTCAVVSGVVACWGMNWHGELGDGTLTNRPAPARVSGLDQGGAAVAAGTCPYPAPSAHTCAVTTAGALRCWGDNHSGQVGDGTNPPEWTTVPVGVVGLGGGTNSFFAEGATSAFFGTRFALVNPGERPANAWLELRSPAGTVLPTFRAVPPHTRLTIDVADVVGTVALEFATAVVSNERLVIDRTMTWGDAIRGPYGGHSETGLAAPATTWYLAEGSTIGDFNLFYLLQNPNDAETQVRVRYLRPSGVPLEKTYTLPPWSRTNIWVNVEDFPGYGQALAASDVSAIVDSTSGQPVIVERAMYLDRPGQVFAAGHESAGITTPATQWFLAEGATGPYFDLFVLIANPSDAAASIEATYLLPDGRTVVKHHQVAANSRFNIWVDLEDATLADTAVSTTIRATNDVPIVVERAMWWPGSSDQWYEAHNSPGSTTAGTRWALADGEVGGPHAVQTYILLANTSSAPGTVKVTLLFEHGTSAEQTFPVAGNSRFNVDVGAAFPAAADRRFGAIVESLGVVPARLVVERAMYWDASGQRWAAGTSAPATRLP